MSDDTRPEVEPLSDVAWARVERGLWARMDGSVTVQVAQPRSRRWMWIAAPMVAAAAIVLVVIITRDSSPTENKEIATGSDAGDVRVVAPPNAPTMASFNDAHIELAPASAIVMRQSATATVLERGSAWFAVAPRVDRPAFVVLAGDIKVRVVGTKFRVSRVDERVAVDVEHGLVEVQFHDHLVRVRANESWSSEHPDAASPLKTAAVTPAPPDPNANPDPKTTPDANAPDPSSDPNTKLDPSTKLDPTKPNPKAKPDPNAKLDPSTPDPNAKLDPNAKNPRTNPDSNAKLDPSKPDPKAKPDPNAKPEPKVVPEDERAKFERLSAIEKRDPNAAIAGYLELSQRSGRWAANALYAAGRLAADRHDPRAATILGVYIKRFPNGANVDDARSLLARISAGSR